MASVAQVVFSQSLDEPMSFEAFGDSKSGEWAAPFDGGPAFASSDEDVDS